MTKKKKPDAPERKADTQDGDNFRLRPRKPRTGTSTSPGAWSVALRTVFRYARSCGRASLSSGAQRSGRRTFNQRCAVRVVYAPNRTAGQWRAHGRYITRESAAERGDAPGFNSREEQQDPAAALDAWQGAGDPRIWKLIISPEFGERVDLIRLTREVIASAEKALKTKLEWVAVAHYNTEHPHVHVALRGRRQDGTPLLLPREFVRSRLRERAEDACTAQLGHRTELDAIAARRREVSQQRFTSLDRAIARHTTDGTVTTPAGIDTETRRLIAARLLHLQKMELASESANGQWHVKPDFATVLRAMQRAGDHQRMLAASGVPASDARLPIIVRERRTLEALEGRVLMNGEDEHAGSHGRQYVMIEGTDAKIHLMYYTPEMEQARSRGGLRANSFVRLRKLFSAGKPLIEIDDLGDSEAILKHKAYLRSAAQSLVRRGIIPTDDGWAGWLGRYQRALVKAHDSTRRSRRPGAGTRIAPWRIARRNRLCAGHSQNGQVHAAISSVSIKSSRAFSKHRQAVLRPLRAVTSSGSLGSRALRPGASTRP